MANPPPEHTPNEKRQGPDGVNGQLRSREEREVVLAHLREGWTVSQICRMLFGHPNGKVLVRQWSYDPAFHVECIEAMKGHFGPTLDKAVELSLEADVAGENEGAHKAMALVLNYYARTLDRKVKSVQNEQTIDAAAVVAQQRGPQLQQSVVLGPEGVRELMRGMKNEQERDGAVEAKAELVERTDT